MREKIAFIETYMIEVPKSDQDRVSEIAKSYGLSLVVLYGSRARGMNRPTSDTDIAVKAQHILNVSELLRLEAEFDSIFRFSEVVDARTAPVLLLANIAQHGILLYESEQSIFTEFKIQAINQYIDYKPLLERRRSMIKSLVAGY